MWQRKTKKKSTKVKRKKSEIKSIQGNKTKVNEKLMNRDFDNQDIRYLQNKFEGFFSLKSVPIIIKEFFFS